MGIISNIKTALQGVSRSSSKGVAEAQNVSKYLYNLPTAKFLKGYQLIYRQKEYEVWFRSNINLIMQYYSLWQREPYEIDTNSRVQWYEWTEDQEDTQKVHAPIAPFISSIMNNLVFTGPIDIKINGNDKLNARLQKAFVPNENDIQNFLKRADLMESVSGTIMVVCNYDKELSDYPILEYYEASKIDYCEKFGRFTRLITADEFKKDDKEYCLVTSRSREGIEYKVFKDGNEVDDLLDVYDTPEDIPENYMYGVNPNGTKVLGPILGVWKMRHIMSKEFYEMKLGASDYEGFIDSFQMLDEIYSRFINQIRATQPVLFMSEELMGLKSDGSGGVTVDKPKDLGVKVYEMSGGLSKVDGKSIAAMFNRDVPDLTGVMALAKAFEWVLRQIFVFLGLSPSSGNIDTASVGSNTTSSSLFKREQSTHLLRKQMVDSWTTTIKNIVRLMCQYFDIMDGKKVPNNYDDLDIDVMFPDIDTDDFATRLDESIKGFVAGLFDINEGVKHAFKDKLNKTDMDALIKNLEKQRQEQIDASRVKTNSIEKVSAQKADVLAKTNKMKQDVKK